MLDFKIVFVRDNDDGTVDARIRVYRGDVTTEDELVGEGDGKQLQPVTRFRRASVVGTVNVSGASRAAIRTKIKNAIQARLDPGETLEDKAANF